MWILTFAEIGQQPSKQALTTQIQSSTVKSKDVIDINSLGDTQARASGDDNTFLNVPACKNIKTWMYSDARCAVLVS